MALVHTPSRSTHKGIGRLSNMQSNLEFATCLTVAGAMQGQIRGVHCNAVAACLRAAVLCRAGLLPRCSFGSIL